MCLGGLAPLEAAAPVLTALGGQVRALLDPACPDRTLIKNGGIKIHNHRREDLVAIARFIADLRKQADKNV